MSYKIQSKKERLSPDVPWYQFSSAYKAALQQHNVELVVEQPDVLTYVTTLTFADETAYNAFLADPVVVEEYADIEAYNSFAKIDKKARAV